ncbi:MAG: hypothetical protein JWR80_8032 [Bradyrhizobium sp.]|nr:hypothetical protein [Bradyrhizobium sp.]
MSDASRKIESVIADQVMEVARDPDVPLDRPSAKPVSDAISEKLIPLILNATNNEPWYQSRTVWMLILGLVSTAIRPFTGELFDTAKAVEYADAAAAGGQLVTFGLALYFRLTSTKPIGS